MLILLIDDDNDWNQTMRTYCTKKDISLLRATNQADGLRLNNEFQPDVILLDQVLPDGSGWEIISALRTANAVVKIIGITAYDAQVPANATLDSSFKKPVSIKNLAQHLNPKG